MTWRCWPRNWCRIHSDNLAVGKLVSTASTQFMPSKTAPSPCSTSFPPRSSTSLHARTPSSQPQFPSSNPAGRNTTPRNSAGVGYSAASITARSASSTAVPGTAGNRRPVSTFPHSRNMTSSLQTRPFRSMTRPSCSSTSRSPPHTSSQTRFPASRPGPI